MKKYYFFLILLQSGLAICQMISANNLLLEFNDLAKMVNEPATILKNETILRLGPSNLNDANIIFLPEIHDDPESLKNQLILLANEKVKKGEVFVLDESLDSFKKSSWDIFSEKSLEIVAAKETEKNNEKYAPRIFEKKLSSLAQYLSKMEGGLQYVSEKSIWSLPSLASFSEPFYGWDNNSKNSSLTQRNFYMTKSLDQALKIKPRVFVMLGARHVPDLEFLSSKSLLCNGEQFNNQDEYFSYIKNNFGMAPNLSMGIGSTLPIYEFLKDKKYAILFNKSFYPKFSHVMKNFIKESGIDKCVKI